MANLFQSLTRDLGIDIGTTTTNVFVDGRGVVVSEPSVVATDTKQEGIVAVGLDAERLLIRTPDTLDEMRPLQDGVIVDYRVTMTMLKYFMHKASPKAVRRVRVLMGVPCGITDVEKRAMTDAIVQAGAREAHLIESPVAAALGAGLPIFEAVGNMCIDIGGGTTDVGVISLGGMVVGKSARIGGNDFNEAILQYIKQCFSVLVSNETVEEIKLQLGTVAEPNSEEEFLFTGRDMENGLVKRISIHQSEVYQVLQEPFQRILEVIRSVVEQIPPELSADIVDRGIVLTGATALMAGFGERISKEIGVPVHIANDPGFAVARGLGLAFKEFDRMDRFIIASKDREGRA